VGMVSEEYAALRIRLIVVFLRLSSIILVLGIFVVMRLVLVLFLGL